MSQISPEPLVTWDSQNGGSLEAVGPAEIVSFDLGEIVITNRQGQEIHRDEVGDWLHSLGMPWTSAWMSGVDVQYDPVAQRWCATAHEWHSGDVYIALSHTSSIGSQWTTFTFSNGFVKGEEADDLKYAEYSSARLGFGGGIVAVTLLLDDHDGRNVDWEEDDSGFVILAVGDIQGGGNSPLTGRQFRVSHDEFQYDSGAPIPARTFSAASGLYFLSLEEEDTARYALSKLSFSGTSFSFSKHYAEFLRPSLNSDEGPATAIQPQTTVRLTHEDELGDVTQYADGTVDLIPDQRNIRDVVVRDSHLWAVHEGLDLGAGVVRTHWLQIRLSSPRAIIQSGRLGGGGDSISCIAPSIGVNGAHDVLIGCTLTGPHHFPSAAYALRFGSDAAGSLRGLRAFTAGNRLKPASSFYPGDNLAGWASHSLTVIDPVDDTGFWTRQAVMLAPSPYETHWMARVFGNIPPTITQQPQSVTVPPNANASFSIAATGNDLHYQWYHNDTLLPGRVSTSMNVLNVNALTTGYYKCRVNNPGGEAWSDEAFLGLTTGNPGVFVFVNSQGQAITSAGFNEKPPTFQGIRIPRYLNVKRLNGSDGRVRVAVNLHGRFDPPTMTATDYWDYQSIKTASPRSRFFVGPGALTFEDGETQKSVLLNIRDDTMVEPGFPEGIEATLAPDTTTGAATTTPSLAINIIDDDFTPTFQAALDTNLTFTNEGTRWKAQTGVTSDGVDAVQSDITGPAEPSVFSSTFNTTGTLVFRWKTEATEFDRLQLVRRGIRGGDVVISELAGRTDWQTAVLPINDSALFDTTVDWRFVRGAESTDLLATGFVDEVKFHPGKGGIVEFEKSAWSVDEGAATLSLTLRRLGQSADAGAVNVSLQSVSATAGVDFQSLPTGTITFDAGVTTRTVSVTILPDQTTEPVESFRAVLSPSGTGVIGIGPLETATISIVDQPGETYASWSALKFSAAQLANPAISGKLADPDGDGLSNLMEYALNGNPLAAASAPWPQSAFEDVPGEDVQRHSLTFARRKQALDLTYIVQRSADGTTWQDGATLSPAGITNIPEIIQLVGASGSPVESRIVRDGASVVPGEQAWMRLKVTSP